jgi:microcystin degradation protein MlrC
MAEQATALVVYKTYPHVDQRERGVQAAGITARTVRGEVRPTQALAQPPLIVPIRDQETGVEPMASILQQARALEQEDGILAASVAGGFAYADVPEMGTSVVVVTDGDPARAQAEADRLSARIWEVRDQFKVDLPDAAMAVAQAVLSSRTPVILVDFGDNVGGGSAGDGTFLLREILAQGVSGAVVVLAAPGEVSLCVAAGVRNEVELVVGGQIDNHHGAPVAVRGRVRTLHDGLYTETEPRHGGVRFHDQGVTAVVEIQGPNTLVLTSRRMPPFSLEQLRSVGIQPERERIIVVKAAIAYKAAYAPIAGTIIEVDTPGLTACNPARFTYHRIRRPLFPLDEM